MSKKNCLHKCVAYRNMTILNLLLDSGSDIDSRDKNGMTPLHIAAKENYEEGLNVLLNRGADVNLEDNNGNSSLHEGVKNLNVVKALLNKGATPNSINFHFETPLHLAIIQSSIDVITLLLIAGADVNAKTLLGYTPLLFAMENCSYDTVQLLMHNGADVNLATNSGLTPLHIAAESKELYIMQLLINAGADPNRIETAGVWAISDIQNKLGKTALHYSALSGSALCSQLLLESGADPKIKDSCGDTPLHLMVIEPDDPEVIKLFIKKGANVNAKNKSGRTPLFEGVGNPKVTRLLLDLGAEVNARDMDGNTPLHVSVCSSQKSVNLLLHAGANVNEKDLKGVTPLEYSLTNGYVSIEKLLDTLKNLVEWGASWEEVEYHKIPVMPQTYSLAETIYKEHSLKLECVKLFKNLNLDWNSVNNAQAPFLKELKEIKNTLCGHNYLIDVFYKWDDPYFVTNDILHREVMEAENKFPLYHAHLKATYFSAIKRFKLLNQIEDYFNVDILARAMRRTILTYLKNDELENLIRTVKNELKNDE